MKTHASIIGTAVVILLASPSPASAYLDPGTGSMVFQVAIGGILSALAVAKLYWRRITRQQEIKDDAGAGQTSTTLEKDAGK